jgi:hypothetical protein
VQVTLEKIQARLEKAHTGLAMREKPDRRPDDDGAPGWVLQLAPRPPFLAGREDLLSELDARLSGGASRVPQVVALHGLAGAGKTSLALAYAHNHLGEDSITWQFAAEDPAVLAAGFTGLATALGVPEGAGNPVVAVHRALAGAAAGWLLMFDTAPGPEALEGLVPPVGDGRVLITSRNALWPPEQALEVPVLDLGAAADFLVARTGDTDRLAAAGLAEAVDGLPLALEQAAAYAQATGNSLATYLTLFHKRRADLLRRGGPARRTVATTWALAFNELEHSDPGAAGLLRLLACCAPEAIPLRLLLRPRPGLAEQMSSDVAEMLAPLLDDELAVADAVAALRRFSLGRPAGDGLVSVHRLVQAVTTDQMPKKLREAWRHAAATVIEAAIPKDPQLPADWPEFAALLPHAQAALTADSRGMRQMASYLGHSGSYVAARELLRAILKERVQVLGAKDPATLTARADLAHWTGEAGDAVGARDQYAALLPIRQEVLGRVHPGILTTRAGLAHWTGEAGDAVGARDQYAALLPTFDRVRGPDHENTLAARSNLARWTGEAGGPVGARDQYAALLPVVERVLGLDHPYTLATRSDLARWTGEAGDPVGARDQYAALLPVFERVLGPEHPNTLATRGNLAHWTGEAGDVAGACDQYAALLPGVERVLGPDHPNTLAIRRDLASWTQEAEHGPRPDAA